MPYVFIENFRQGMDRRSSIDNAPTGSVWDLKNAHLNRSGEIEVRKKFVSKYSLPTGQTFGLEATNSALYVFGSATSPSVPVGVTYQRLQHPDGLSMTALLSSDVFDGKVYAVAEYSDGSIHHFYDGARVTDWDDGIVRIAMANNSGIASHLSSVIDDAAYTVSVSTDTITIEAAVAGTPFTISAVTENVSGGTDDQAILLTETQSNVPGVDEVQSSCSLQVVESRGTAGTDQITSITINSVNVLGSAVNASDNPAVTAALIAVTINNYTSSPNYTAEASGSTVVITAEPGTGYGPNYYDVVVNTTGEVIVSTGGFTISGGDSNHTAATGTLTLLTGAGGDSVDTVTVNGVDVLGVPVPYNTSLTQTAADIASQINTFTSSPDYSASSAGAVVTITAAPIVCSDANGFVVNATVTGTITFNKTNMAGGVCNAIDVVTVNGVDILGSKIRYSTSTSNTAELVAAQINSYSSSPEYYATTRGSSIYISAGASGYEASALPLVVTPEGNVTYTDSTDILSTVTDMTGGITAVAGQSQIYTAQVTGTFEVGDKYTIILDGKHFGAQYMPADKASVVLTHNTKVYALVNSLLQYSAIDSPTQWNVDEDVGAGYNNLANHAGGSEQLTAVQTYQDNLAIFSSNVIQVWYVDPDEAVNTNLKTLKNIGSTSPKSVVAFGDSDVFFLGSKGVRSLRARDSSNSAYVEDVGTSIDPYLLDHLSGLTQAEIDSACGLIDPEEGRYWVAVGDKVFVFSYFPSSKISGWSYYEPGFSITDMVDYGNRIYVRADDTIYLYGGDDNATYHAVNEIETVVQLPFLHGGKPADFKQVIGVDVSTEGEWYSTILVDPSDLTRHVVVGTLAGFTYNDSHAATVGKVTHVAPKFVHSAGGYAKLANIGLHFNMAERESP